MFKEDKLIMYWTNCTLEEHGEILLCGVGSVFHLQCLTFYQKKKIITEIYHASWLDFSFSRKLNGLIEEEEKTT